MYWFAWDFFGLSSQPKAGTCLGVTGMVPVYTCSSSSAAGHRSTAFELYIKHALREKGCALREKGAQKAQLTMPSYLHCSGLSARLSSQLQK